MGVAKGLAVLGVVLVGLGLFATVFYQSGLLQKMQQENNALSLKAFTATPATSSKGEQTTPLSNPNGDTVIAIIQHHRPLENEILQALDQGAFESEF